MSERDRLAELLHTEKYLGPAIHEQAYAMQEPSFGADDCIECQSLADRLIAAGVSLAPRAEGLDDLDVFTVANADAMLVRLRHGSEKFGALSWRQGPWPYDDADNLARLRRAVDHLEAAHRNTDDPTEWRKRAADVANQAFMFADPARLSDTGERP